MALYSVVQLRLGIADTSYFVDADVLLRPPEYDPQHAFFRIFNNGRFPLEPFHKNIGAARVTPPALRLAEESVIAAP